MEEKLRHGENGTIYFNPNDPESVNAAIKEVVAVSQLHGYREGSKEIHRAKEYWSGFGAGFLVAGLVFLAGAMTYYIRVRKGKK